MNAYVTDYSHGLEFLEHLGGVSWADAPRPRRWHRCKPQTRGFFHGRMTYRCACGAAAVDWPEIWINRNSR